MLHLVALALALLSTVTSTNLNLTAIAAHNGTSVFECWQIQPSISISTQAGTAGSAGQFLGSVTNATFSEIPAGFDGGPHRAPAAQYVFYFSGVAHITVPSGDSVYVVGGPSSLIIAVDTPDVSTIGHNTSYPGQTSTVALQLPFGPSGVNHTVLHGGACYANESGSLEGGMM